MFSTKQEVDRHVDTNLKRINNEKERVQRYFSFAKLYFNVKEYEQARRYVSSYLGVNCNSSEAYKLLGDIFHKLNKEEAALDAYRNSLQLNPAQNSLILKVCEIMGDESVKITESNARYICDLADSFGSRHPSVLALKDKLLISQNENPKEVTNLLLAELEHRPTDIMLRVRFLRHLLQNAMVREAYKHAIDVYYNDFDIFLNNYRWHEIVAEVLMKYQKTTSDVDLTWEFWFFFIGILERLVALALDDHQREYTKNNNEYAQKVFNLDQAFYNAMKNCEKSCNDRQLLNTFDQHYTAQLCFHFSVLYIKHIMTKGNFNNENDAKSILPLLFVAYNTQIPDMVHCMWKDEKKVKLIRKWHRDGGFRRSQAGHIIVRWTKESATRTEIIEKCKRVTFSNWRERFYKNVFPDRDQQLRLSTSSFITNTHLYEITTHLPDANVLSLSDEVAQHMYPDTLHYYVWICLHSAQYNEFTVKTFEGLPYSVKNLKNCGAETLNILDIHAFIMCTTLCTLSDLSSENNKKLSSFLGDRQFNIFGDTTILPAGLSKHLCTVDQAQFFTIAYKMYKNEVTSNMSEIRTCLLRGIEEMRCHPQRLLNVRLLIKLATIFAERTEKQYLTVQSEIEFTEARAELYWQTALNLLEKLANNQKILQPTSSLFKYPNDEMTKHDLNAALTKGKLFIAQQLIKRKSYEEANDLLGSVQDPYGSFYQAEIYKALFEEGSHNNDKEDTQQQIYLVTRARDYLYTTLDRLRDYGTQPDHPLNVHLASDIEYIERQLAQLEDGDFDAPTMQPDRSSFAHNNTSLIANFSQSTPMRRIHPSPERLDAQIRQLTCNRESENQQVVQQMKCMVELQKNLLEEWKSIRNVCTNATSDITNQIVPAIKEAFKVSFDELRTSIEEVINFRNVTDMVFELKKEISDLKAASTAQQQRQRNVSASNPITDEDIYNIAMNQEFPAGDFSSLYPGYCTVPSTSRNTSASAAFTTPVYNSNFLTGAPPPIMSSSVLNYPSYGNGIHPPPVIVNPPPLPIIFEPPPPLIPVLSSSSTTITGPLFKDSKHMPVDRAPPVNVVITTSDPLPSKHVQNKTNQILSVTIPPQHLKGSPSKPSVLPHNYQIPMPDTTTVAVPSFLTETTLNTSSKSTLSDKSIGASLAEEIAKNIDEKALNKSTLNATERYEDEEIDPCPDFQPIIPLPDEVTVNTGEEDETVLFSARARLYRYQGNDWRERGVGTLKILKHITSKKVRIVMRRDQIHKICANHFLAADMKLTPKLKTDGAFIWAAQDFADGEMVLEKFCVRFKIIEDAEHFRQVFEREVEQLLNVSNSETSTVVNEQVLFESDFVNLYSSSCIGDSNWKDFGTGYIKLVESATQINIVWSKTVNSVPVIAHQLLKSMQFVKQKDETVTWFLKDYSQGVFKVKFVNNDALVNPFLDVLHYAQHHYLDENGKVVYMEDHNRKTVKLEDTTHLPAHTYKAVKGSWECKNCLIVNEARESLCVACETPKPSLVTPFTTPTKSNEEISTGTKINLDAWGETFKPKAGSWECSQCYIRNEGDKVNCISCTAPKTGAQTAAPTTKTNTVFNFSGKVAEPLANPFTTFVFNTTATTITTQTSNTTTASSSSSVFSFASINSNTVSGDNVGSGNRFIFGTTQPTTHHFEFTPKSPGRRISGGSASGRGDDEGEDTNLAQDEDEENDNIYFKPVIPLPELVDVKTGEENEEVLYSHRAKLYRFKTSEWKERGVGDIKILRDKGSNKLRVLMRRDQVHKICLNHLLTEDIEYTSKDDDRTWMFCAPDFSEGNLSHDQFCLRFKNGEIALEFKNAVNDALLSSQEKDEKQDQSKPHTIPSADSGPHANDSDLIVVSETFVTQEEIKEATKLGLPPKYFAYRQLPNCTCAQCKKDDDYYNETSDKPTSKPSDIVTCSPNVSKSTPKQPTNFFANISLSTTPGQNVPTTSFFGTSASNLSNIFSGVSSSQKNIFASPVTAQTKGGSIFGPALDESIETKEKSIDIKSEIAEATTPTSSSSFASANNTLFDSADKKNTSAALSNFVFCTPGSETKSVLGSSNESFPSLDGTNKNTTLFAGGSLFPNRPSIFSTSENATETDDKNSGPSTAGSIFGMKASLAAKSETSTTSGLKIFGGEPIISLTSNLKEDDAAVLSVSGENDVSFASVAQGKTAFFHTAATESKNGQPFAFLGAGMPVFGSTKRTTATDEQKTSSATQEDNSEETPGEDYDPHYEPIIPLPDVVAVQTGEEDEDVLFNERAKLFMYFSDLKEWKERGTGAMKILHHPTNNTRRFLLRREQVHKVALNQLITPDIDLQPMTTSDRAWVWAGHNYADEECALQKLAIRFKNAEIAKQFYNCVENVIKEIHQNKQDSSYQADLGENYDGESENEDDYETTDDPDYDDEDYRD